ncbi:bifunctional DNA-formamidopyrimidine glycosylase/DNA-(apurinic or apyrimidinic site) lyase [uncultured Methylovirgula sp.]|uniref:bifunctional DNA-formamidopyrimidine glycosylase/DNA-(apurinic or apyrimidinic site) lyase n=1 Tax=uncultured Methylovirgula sp. TaxID=1285960 RepID=UPI0026028A57|nr:bifunctional DNA-formamidopyrimidine glycosylase/DNA-(apurinic or apyrimidinic site) lyase [uncultured Methylovirgula sp.]
MPELPEVETVRRGLAPVFVGARLLRVEQRRANLRFPFPADFSARLMGRMVTALRRRAKYLIADLDHGEALVMHLGMSGSFRIEDGGDENIPGLFHNSRGKDAAHDHVVFILSSGKRVIYNDPRRFGFMLLVKQDLLAAHPLFRDVGIEPLGDALTGATLARLFAGKKAPLKAALLDQRLLAGLGNIYVSEALYRAALSPRRAAGSLARKNGTPTPRADLLAKAIRAVLEEAIEAGGSSLRDHRQANGELGYFQHNFRVYDRAGAPCPRPGCGGTIKRIVQSGRASFYCATCQK